MPDEANYYDSKGQYLYNKGDVKGAKMMWKKVKALKPSFEKNHNSNLQKLLGYD